MKRVIISVVLSLICCVPVLAIKPPSEDEFKKYLNLSTKQEGQINKINTRTINEINQIYVQLNSGKTYEEQQLLHKKIHNIYENKEKEIMKVLNFWQKMKYKEYRSRRY